MTGVAPMINEHFAGLEDPRAEHLNDHTLLDIITVAICAVICGAEGWTDVELFGNERLEWLRQFLRLENGIPSHDTFGRVFARLDPVQFEQCFLSWVAAVFQMTEGEVVAIDGKTVRRSHDRGCGKTAIHLVSAWATANHLVLGQRKVDDKSNEITAIPELLHLLELNGCVVTIDAMGCQTEIAEQIVEQGADYVLAVKENQPHLLEDMTLFFDLAQQNDFAKVEHTYHRTVNGGHGRVETRECWAISGQESLDFLRGARNWSGLTTIVMVRARRQIGQERSEETRYFISSVPNDAKRLLHAVRSHWGIENSLHWVLDVAMGEDDSRIRRDHAAENMSLLRRMALNLLKQEKTLKRGVQGKRLKAALSPDYLLKVLQVG
ncbi:MAG: ISAs1 family transposase [Candidatus Promineifilaceae bacterium]|nr:ISAs1 family transposase [Candidatus Promineifilaceae bacterium]